MEDLQVYYDMVDGCIRELGVDPAICKGEKPGQWSLKRGSAPVWIDVFYDEHNKCSYFQVMAPVVKVPAVNTQAFYQEVLEIAHNLYGVGFTKFQDWLYVKAIRETEGLDASEITATMNRVGFYADQYDDELQAKYNAVSGRKSDV
ncbi:MAG: YbjN domain-containing protein [Bacteroidia bacterium]